MREVSSIRHYGGFLGAGLMAFSTDAAILETLTHMGWHPLAARPFAISIAMIVSWIVNRTVTFAMHSPPSLREYLRFAAVSWSAQVVNFAVFGAIILLRPATLPFIALVVASVVAMFVSYFGFRHGVFSHRTNAPWEEPPSAAKPSETP